VARADALARRFLRRALLAFTFLAAAGTVFASRPLTTEDADILGDKRCQLESWVDRGDDHAIAWLAPACNFGLGIEWQAGLSRTRASGRTFASESYLQAKGLFKEIDAHSRWGFGWVVGIARDPLRATRRGWQDPYVIIPASAAWGDALVHANLGWSRNRAEGRDRSIWGAALEVPGGERLTWVAEAFGEGPGNPFLRGGVRVRLVKDVFEADLTIVSRPGGTREERYLSLGVFWQSGRLLP
jgi:hypothetical protein